MSKLSLDSKCRSQEQLGNENTALAAGGLDCLPHGGAVITLLQICNLNHRQSYLDIFMVSLTGPVMALIAVIILGSVFGSFRPGSRWRFSQKK